ERDGKAGVAHVAAERDVVRRPALERERRHEDEGHRRRGAEAEVRPLLGDELSHLPAVGGQERRHQTASLATAWSTGGGGAASCSVSWKKSCSSVACCGISAWTPIRRWARGITQRSKQPADAPQA